MEEEIAGTLTKQEQAQRRRFVAEYLVDYDPLGAAIRIGFAKGFAEQYAGIFMQEPYTRKLISDKTEALGVMDEAAEHKRRVLAGLYRITADRYGSASSKVAAYAQISKIVGLDAPVKTEQTVTVASTGPDTSHLTVEELEQIKKQLYAPAIAS